MYLPHICAQVLVLLQYVEPYFGTYDRASPTYRSPHRIVDMKTNTSDHMRFRRVDIHARKVRVLTPTKGRCVRDQGSPRIQARIPNSTR